MIIFAMLFAFTACSFGRDSSESSEESSGASESVEESSSSAESSSQAEEPTGAPEPTATPEPTPTEVPTPSVDHTGHASVKTFDCLTTGETIDSIAGLGADLLAVSTTTRAIDGEFNGGDNQHSTLFLVDMKGNAVKRSVENVTVDERLIGASEEFGFVSNNLLENTVSVYSAGFEKLKTFENTGDDCIFDPENGKV